MARPKAKELTERELEIMHVFWDAGDLTAVEVRDELADRGRELAYTTVATLIRILAEKNFLEQVNDERPFVYRPQRTFDEVSRLLVGDLVERVFGGSRENAADVLDGSAQADEEGTSDSRTSPQGASAMNQFGLVLVWCAVQVTVVAAVAAVCALAIRRRAASVRSLVVLTGLVLIIGLTALAFSPWPNWTRIVSTAADVAPPSDAQPQPPPATTAADTESDDPAPRPPREDADRATMAAAANAFWNELQRGRTAESSSSSVAWPKLVAALFLLGGGFALLRLTAGVVAVRWHRRQSRVVDAAALREMVDVLSAELCCSSAVELRESDDLVTAATVGWRRPLILLPSDWRSWNTQQQRVVLAHELAHIKRNDYAAGLCAQIGLMLHFYHPLVHWLVGRLRLDQELAADSLAARLSGGQKPYLTTLAEMALRQPDRPLGWPARTFLPTRRTFLRRIEMLRDSNQLLTPTPTVWRTLSIALVVLAGVLAAGLRGSGGQDEARSLAAEQPQLPQLAQNKQVAQANTRRRAAPQRKPFSLAYVPRDAVIVTGIRPSIMRQPQLGLAGLLNAQKGFAEDFGIDVRQIEQVMHVFLLDDKPRAHPQFAAFIVRTAQADDAQKLAANFAPEAEKVSYGSVTYYQSEKAFYYFPEPTTAVVTFEEGYMRRAIVAGRAGAGDTMWAPSWQRVHDKDAAVVLDLAALRTSLDSELDHAPASARLQMAMFAPMWRNADRATLSVQLSDGLTVDAVAHCSNAEQARAVSDTVSAVMTLGKTTLSQARRAASQDGTPQGAMALQMADLVDRLIDRVETNTKDTDVTASTSLDRQATAQLIAGLLPAVTAARTAARRAQSMNNLKQLALAMHNYHDVHGRFPPASVIGPDGETPHSWRVAVLPYLEAKDLYDEYRLNEPWDSPHNKALIEKMPEVFRHPGAQKDKFDSSYFALVGPGTVFSGDEGTQIRDIRDGTSNTIMLVEAKRDVPWTKPEDIAYDVDQAIPPLGGHQEGIFQVAMCDGAVRVVADAVDKKVLRLMITKDDGQPVPNF